MRALSSGEERYINESTLGWQMIINQILFSPVKIPEAVTTRIQELDELYIKEFRDYYINNSSNEGQIDASKLQADFEEAWIPKHPEFTDPDLLFAECSEEIKEKIRAHFERFK